MSKKIMTKNTDKQAIDNLADNFNGYAALLRKIKQRVLVAQQRAIYAANEEMLRMYWDIGGMLQQSQDGRWLGQENLATLVRGLEERLFRNKGFFCAQHAVYDTVLQRIQSRTYDGERC